MFLNKHLHKAVWLRWMSWLCVAVLTFSACSGEGTEDGNTENIEKRGLYFELSINEQNKQTHNLRGPQAGETGDGTEWGYERERTVTNATLLLYTDAKGINGDANTRIEHALYAPQINKVTENGTTYYRSEILHSDQSISPRTYHILVVCNLGDCTRFEGKTLEEVRNEIETDIYTQSDADDPTTATHFVMASAEDASLNISSEIGGVDNPVRFNVSVERLAARIDFSPGNTNNNSALTTEQITLADGSSQSVTGYTYTVKDASSYVDTNDRFILTSVTPFNLAESGTRLLKCVSNYYDGTGLNYLGKETTDNITGNASNYVLDPWTTQKGLTAVSELTYQNPYADALSGNLTEQAVKATDATNTYKGNNYYILTYANENTLTPSSLRSLFATGIMVKGYYGTYNATTKTTRYSAKTYYYGIRHADPNNTAGNVPMKYGIVRNNIYRLYINRITSLGIIMLNVQQWSTITMDEIEM